jgi:hypothetical protein
LSMRVTNSPWAATGKPGMLRASIFFFFVETRA